MICSCIYLFIYMYFFTFSPSSPLDERGWLYWLDIPHLVLHPKTMECTFFQSKLYDRLRVVSLFSWSVDTTIFPYFLFTYECECIYSILLFFFFFFRLEFRPAGKERKSNWSRCPRISLVVSNNIEPLSYGNELTGFETRLQGHPMDLFLKISVLQANFCWLGDLKK